jgi:hypothetical protein
MSYAEGANGLIPGVKDIDDPVQANQLEQGANRLLQTEHLQIAPGTVQLSKA